MAMFEHNPTPYKWPHHNLCTCLHNLNLEDVFLTFCPNPYNQSNRCLNKFSSALKGLICMWRKIYPCIWRVSEWWVSHQFCEYIWHESMESWFHILFKLAQNISGWSLMVLEAFFVWPDGKKRTSLNQRLMRQNIIHCTVAPPSGWSGPSRLLSIKRQFHQVSQLHDLQFGLHGLFYYRRRRSWVKQSELSKLHVWTPNNQNKLLLWFWSNIRPFIVKIQLIKM